jgi:hypothetical protein
MTSAPIVVYKNISMMTLLSVLFCFLFDASSQYDIGFDKVEINAGPPAAIVLVVPAVLIASGIVIYLDQKGKFKKNENREITEYSDSTSINNNANGNDTMNVGISRRHRYGGLNAGNKRR